MRSIRAFSTLNSAVGGGGRAAVTAIGASSQRYHFTRADATCTAPAFGYKFHLQAFRSAVHGVVGIRFFSVGNEVPHAAAAANFDPKDVVLYQYEACPFCNKVKAFLDYYKIPYKVVEVNPISKKEINWSEYKKVPILKVGGELMVDSSARDFSMVRYSPEDLKSNGKLIDLFESWMEKYGKKYHSLEEKLEKFEVFKDSLKYIDETNKKVTSYRLGLNEFADLTQEEFQKIYLGFKPGMS